MATPLRITVGFLGVYAGLVAMVHGAFATLQGGRSPSGLMFSAIGEPCLPDEVWHACLPAITLIPHLLISGILAMAAGAAMAVWAGVFAGRRRGGIVLAGLSLAALLVGGGFVPVFIGLVAAIAAGRLGAPAVAVRPGAPTGSVPTARRILAAAWPWPIIVMAIWLPGSWLVGYFFADVMLAASTGLFVVFDLGMPVIAAVTAVARSGLGRKNS